MLTATSRCRVLVVGASLGGLSAALALHSQGFDVHVYDKARVFHQGAGTALTLWPNGLRALSRIDPTIVDELCKRGMRRAATVHLRMDGSIAGRTPIEVESAYGMPALIVRWTDLQQVLLERVSPEFITNNERCVDVVVHSDSGTRKVDLVFESGLRASGDLVVGADGIRSVLRERWFNDAPPVYGGRMLWRSIVDDFEHPLLQPNDSVFIQSPVGSFGTKHLGSRCAYWSVNQKAPELPADAGVPLAPDAMRARVLQRLEAYPEIAREIVMRTDLTRHPILEYPVLDHVPLDTWVRNGVALVGDAAHAMDPALGQGANLTFEDAVVLSHSLQGCAQLASRERETALDAALAIYEQRRLFRVHAVQARNALTVRALMGGSGSAEDWKRMLSDHAGGGRGKEAVLQAAEQDGKSFADFLFGFDPLPASQV